MSYQKFLHVGLALDPIHVGTGGARIGRVDLSIVRDPVTRVPKIPGSSLAGVYRTYVAMEETNAQPNRSVGGAPWPYYPHCAGLGQARGSYRGHCAQPDCPVCVVFGFARGRDQAGGFAGLAAFSDAHVLLFPVPTRQGPHWVTCPMALRTVGIEVAGIDQDAVYLENAGSNPLNLGWLLLPAQPCPQLSGLKGQLSQWGVPDYVRNRIALLPDRLFVQVVNSNLEVRTSVSIDPETGAAEEGALFSYEALPRTTVLGWEVIAKNPQHFKIDGRDINLIKGQHQNTPQAVHEVVKQAHPYLEHLGVGGMGHRGMGRLKVLYAGDPLPSPLSIECGGTASATANEGSASQVGEGRHAG